MGGGVSLMVLLGGIGVGSSEPSKSKSGFVEIITRAEEYGVPGKFRHASDPKLKAVNDAIWSAASAIGAKDGRALGGGGFAGGTGMPALEALFRLYRLRSFILRIAFLWGKNRKRIENDWVSPYALQLFVNTRS